eukprot:TRINITY_DN8046_c0_g1_i15.p1 TRINITY_DN8046_c0_g1~~TRINITY_DN8046_c0_g1_i15.p1  ORF type:complete len:343 (+),score=69.30 TRINITY_DN8046_c0_g1_i15:196-1224(+)
MEASAIDIELASNDCVSGEFIEGNLILTLSSDVPPGKILNVQVSFIGKEIITKKGIKVNENVFIDDNFSVSIAISEAATNYTKPFIISTPKNLPCSFTYADNVVSSSIEYSLNAALPDNPSTARKTVNIFTSVSPLWSDRCFFSDTGEVGCTCCMVCCFLCCEKRLTKIEVTIAREALIGDPKIPLVVNVDNTLSRSNVAGIVFNFSRLVMFTSELGEVTYAKKYPIASFKGPLEVNAKEKRTNVVMSIPLIDNGIYLLKEPTVYSRHTICEYQLEAKLVYGSGCCLCCNNGPRLVIPLPVIEQKKAVEGEKELVEKKNVDLVLNAANIVDPYQIMKLTMKV